MFGLGCQVVGVVSALVGFFLLAGWAWLLFVGGLVLVVVGVLAELSAPRLGWKDGS